MTLTLELRPEAEAGLLSQARAKGISLDAYVQELLQQVAGSAPVQKMSADDWEKALDEWIETSPAVPHLPDEALRREFLYRRD
jgi:hypothetical protein